MRFSDDMDSVRLPRMLKFARRRPLRKKLVTDFTVAVDRQRRLHALFRPHRDDDGSRYERRLRVLVLSPPGPGAPGFDQGVQASARINEWKTEYERGEPRCAPRGARRVRPDARRARTSFGRSATRSTIGSRTWVFNLLWRSFTAEVVYDQNVRQPISKLTRIPYTGCNPRGLMFRRAAKDTVQDPSWHYHRIPGCGLRGVSRCAARSGAPRGSPFQLIVKSLKRRRFPSASRQASVGSTPDDKLKERGHPSSTRRIGHRGHRGNNMSRGRENLCRACSAMTGLAGAAGVGAGIPAICRKAAWRIATREGPSTIRTIRKRRGILQQAGRRIFRPELYARIQRGRQARLPDAGSSTAYAPPIDFRPRRTTAIPYFP